MAHRPTDRPAPRDAGTLRALRPGRRSRLPEFTLKAIVLGVLFGLLFGASTVYLGLRAGLTVSASIPIAVLAISVLKRLGGSTILENNIVQTIGSAGESLAAGVVFTIPALIFLLPRGPAYFNYLQITMLAIRRRHPRRADDGAAAARAHRQGARRAALSGRHGLRRRAGRRRARRRAGEDWCSWASAIGALWKACRGSSRSSGPRSATRSPRTSFFPNATINLDLSPEYLGVGYVIGPRIAGMMFAGGVLSWLVLLPLLSILGQLHDRAASAVRARPSGAPDRSDERRTALERLHPLHRRRRRAGRRA